jgi:O-antigen/teichoic acid export membrane protein
MKLLEVFKASAIGKMTVPALTGAASAGTWAGNLMVGAQRTARHPMAEGAMLLAGAQYAAAAIGLVTSVVSARILGPNDFGLSAVVVSYPMLLGALVGVKSGSITTRYIAAFRERRHDDMLKGICLLGYAVDIFVSLLAFVLVAATAGWVSATFFHAPQAALLMVAFAAAFPVWCLYGTSSAILVSFEKFGWVAALQILDQGLGAGLVIGLIAAGFGVPGAVLGAAAGHFLIGVIALFAASSVFHRERSTHWWRGSITSLKPLRKEISSLFGWNYLVVTWSGLIGQVPLMVLAHLRGTEAAGFYRLATSIVAVGSYLETSMGKVAYPVLSARWCSGSRTHLRQALRHWTLRAGLPVGLLVLFTIPFYPILVPLLFGAHYAPMAGGVQIMMAGAAVSAMFFWLNSFYYASANLSFWTVGYALQSIFVVGLAWIFVQRWGFSGMASLVAFGKIAFTLAMIGVFYRLGPNQPTNKASAS